MKIRNLLIIAVALLSLSLAACNNSNVITTADQTVTTSNSTSRVFTLSELAAYNGNAGSLAYIAVGGIVYDVTHDANWSNGWHQGLHLAGTDATHAFAGSPHSETYLATLPVVGTLAG